MSKTVLLLLAFGVCCAQAFSASKIHTLSFGKWQLVKAASEEPGKLLDLRIRALYVDGRLKEYTTGQPHDVTERVFVVSRLSRINDTLPGEKQQHWIWEESGWIQVDRANGRVTALNLPEYSYGRSVAAWYRDYVAYCGFSAEAERTYAMVMQLGSRKALLRKLLDSAPGDSGCGAPSWQRDPARVTFSVAQGIDAKFTIRSRSFEVSTPEEDYSE